MSSISLRDNEDALCVFFNERPFLPPCSRANSSSRILFFLSFAIYILRILTYECTLGVFLLCLSLSNTLRHTTPHIRSHITQHNRDIVTCLRISSVTAGSSADTQHTVSDNKSDTSQLSTIHQTLKPSNPHSSLLTPHPPPKPPTPQNPP